MSAVGGERGKSTGSGRRYSRRSFLARVCPAAAFGGALAFVSGSGLAQTPATRRITDRDSGVRADPIGRGRGRPPTYASDSDHENPRLTGDVFESDPPPGKRTGITDRDSGPSADPVNYGSQPGRPRKRQPRSGR